MNRRIIVPLSGKRYTYGTELLVNGGFETLVAPFMRQIEREEVEATPLTLWARILVWLAGVWGVVKAAAKKAAITIREWSIREWNKFVSLVERAWRRLWRR